MQTTLYYRQGSSDKVYQAAIEPRGDGHVVTFAYGRRGQTLTAGTKTPKPVSLEEAQGIHAKLIASKLAKGYSPSEDGTPYASTGNEGRDSGIRCQLLNPVDEEQLERLLNDSRHCLQEKHDGRRMMVRKQGPETTGINRRGLIVPLPEPIALAAGELPTDCLIDGEAVGDVLHAFDLLEVGGVDVRQRTYLDRIAGVLRLLDPDGAIRPVLTSVNPEDKRDAFLKLRQAGAEGVVLKHLDATFSPGRPASGGSQLKFKFVESASFIVAGRNGTKRSVALELVSADGARVSAGNVTIPANHDVPEKGCVVEVRYLYAHRESGAVYQPVYLGPRDDIPADECTVDQLKFKAEPLAAAKP